MSGSDDCAQAYLIAHHSSETVDTFATFSDFTTALNADLANASLIGLAAEGLPGPTARLPRSKCSSRSRTAPWALRPITRRSWHSLAAGAALERFHL